MRRAAGCHRRNNPKAQGFPLHLRSGNSIDDTNIASVAENRLQLAATMHDAKDECVPVFDTVHNHIFSHGQAAVSLAEVFFARTPNVAKASQRQEFQTAEFKLPATISIDGLPTQPVAS